MSCRVRLLRNIRNSPPRRWPRPLVRPSIPLRGEIIRGARDERRERSSKQPAAARDAVMAVHTELAAADKVRWSSFDIPPSAEQPYVVKAANRIAMNFGKQVDPRAEVQADSYAGPRHRVAPTNGQGYAGGIFLMGEDGR